MYICIQLVLLYLHVRNKYNVLCLALIQGKEKESDREREKVEEMKKVVQVRSVKCRICDVVICSRQSSVSVIADLSQ